MVLINYSILSIEEARGAVALLALSNRDQLSEQITEHRAISFVQWLSKRIDSNKRKIALFGKEDSVLLCCNSLIKAELIRETRFAPAVLHEGENMETRRNPSGSMITYFYGLPNEDPPFVNKFDMLGKDHSGGTWFSGYLSPQVWETLEREVKQLQEG